MDDRAEAEFEQFVHDRAPALLRVAFLLTGDAHAAEDLLQAALAKTFVAWRGLRHRQAADAYTLGISVGAVKRHTSRALEHLRARCLPAAPAPVAVTLDTEEAP